MSLRILWCFWWAVGWSSALLTVLHGGVCCCTLYPQREYIFIAGCECGIAKYVPLVTLEETCLRFCHERGGQVIHGLNYIPVYVSLPYMSSWHGELETFPWSLVFTHNPAPKVDCHLSILIFVFPDSAAEERLQRNYLQLRFCLWKLPSLHQI